MCSLSQYAVLHLMAPLLDAACALKRNLNLVSARCFLISVTGFFQSANVGRELKPMWRLDSLITLSKLKTQARVFQPLDNEE
jgi:hypothetical protein